ncbi:uncharacterized protein LOC131667223 [Phymastichus coffea]|uniref:uncharacterized protein LOC131667223 n=1 Tax=Phymastichus coffea TaxID=108790 RepID=UPI00273AF81E|nr:uncharacterized protein LOC131667223 [Phymastichus coffea]
MSTSSSNALWLALGAVVFSLARGAAVPSAIDLETCVALCSNCDGVAEYKDGHCECSIATGPDRGAECLRRTRRDAWEVGLDVVSCDADADSRSARCAVGLKHVYGKSDVDRVAKYFMQDGPMTGSVFIAPPYDRPAEPTLAKSADCELSLDATRAALPEEATVGAPNLITQPKELIPPAPPAPATPAAPAPALAARPLQKLGLSRIAPQFLSLLGEVISRPLVGLPEAIKNVGRTPSVNRLAQAPVHFFNSLANQMVVDDQVAKANLDNFRSEMDRAQEELKDSLESSKEASKAATADNSAVAGQPPYSIFNPQPMLSWLNPTVGAPAPMQFVGAQAPVQFVGAQAPMHLVGATQLVSTGLPSQLFSTGQMVSAPILANPSYDQSHMVGSQSPSYSIQPQMVAAATPSMISAMPIIQSLGAVPLSSIVSQMSPTYLISSPMTYYPPIQTIADDNVESLEEIPLSFPPQKKICKKSTKNRPSVKYTMDVQAAKDDEQRRQAKTHETSTSTTEVSVIDRTTEQKPKEKSKENKSVISKMKPSSKNKADKKIDERKL